MWCEIPRCSDPTAALGEHDMKNPHPTLTENWCQMMLTITESQTPLKSCICVFSSLLCSLKK